MGYCVSEHEYYVVKQIDIDGVSNLVRYGPTRMRYEVNADKSPYWEIGRAIAQMDKDPTRVFDTLQDDTSLNRSPGIFIYRAGRQLPLTKKFDAILEVYPLPDAPEDGEFIEVINSILIGKILELIHKNKWRRWRNEVSSINCDFDLCPNRISASEHIDGRHLSVKAEFMQSEYHPICNGSCSRSYIYRISMSRTGVAEKTKIIEVERPHLDLMKEDLLGYVMCYNIFDVSLFV